MRPRSRALQPELRAVTIVAHDIGEIGGMERQLSQLIVGLLNGGWRVSVVSRTLALAPHPRLSWITIPGPARPFPIAYPWFALAAGLALLRRRAGLLHVTGALVPNRADLVTVHLCHHAIAERAPIARVRRSSLHYRLNARLSAAISRLAERWCYRPARARMLAGVSHGVTREIEQHFPALAPRLRTIPNGVDTREFRPGRAEGTGLTALFVGGEWEGKGLGAAIQAVAAEERWRLSVVGDGDVDRYRRMASELGASERVHFAGQTKDVAPFYRAADVFLLPTAYETFSLVTYEAAASGLPLFVGRVSGVEDLLEHGVNGWFVERDAAAIAGRLRELADEPARREAMGRAARASSLAFGWDRMVAGYFEAYETLSGATREEVGDEAGDLAPLPRQVEGGQVSGHELAASRNLL